MVQLLGGGVTILLVVAASFLMRSDNRGARLRQIDWWQDVLAITLLVIVGIAVTVGFAEKVDTVQDTRTSMNVAGAAAETLLASGPEAAGELQQELQQYTPTIVTPGKDTASIAELETVLNNYRNRTLTSQETAGQLRQLAETLTEGDVTGSNNVQTEGEVAWIWLNIEKNGKPYCVGAGGIIPEAGNTDIEMFRTLEKGNCEDVQNVLYSVPSAGTGADKLAGLNRVFPLQDWYSELQRSMWAVGLLAGVAVLGIGVMIQLTLKDQTPGTKPRYWKLHTSPKDKLAGIYKAVQRGTAYPGNWISAAVLAGLGSITALTVLIVLQQTQKVGEAGDLGAGIITHVAGFLAGLAVILAGHKAVNRHRVSQDSKASTHRLWLLEQPYTYYGWRGTLALLYNPGQELHNYGQKLAAEHQTPEMLIAERLKPAGGYGRLTLTRQKLATLVEQIEAISKPYQGATEKTCEKGSAETANENSQQVQQT